MSINIPNSPKDLVNKSKADVQRELVSSNPFLRNSFLSAITVALSYRVFDFYIQLQELIKQLFVQTATGDFLRMFGSWFNVVQTASTKATGYVVFTGTVGSSIPAATQLQSSDGLSYETQSTVVIANNSISVSSITRSGTTATVTTAVEHGLSNNVQPTIAGANEAAYNGVKTITVTGPSTFTFTVAGAPATPATGTITVSFVSVEALVNSVDFGLATNQASGASLTIATPISGVDNEAFVDANGLTGGTDIEPDDDYRARVIERVQNPVALFNVNAIVAKAKEVAGVTRVFVQEITPAVGQVTIYFVRDNDVSIIPDAGEITTVKNKILEIKPANTSSADVIVLAPTAVTVNFTFTALSPNTATMQAAITANLRQLFSNTEVGINLKSDAYRSSIFRTTDRETGDQVVSFTLSAPTGDVAITSSQIAVLGTITYP